MTQATESQGKTRYRPFPGLGGKLHIFPALIPLIEIVPWLLGLVGITATLAPLTFYRQHRKQFLIFSAVCFVGALGIIGWKNAHRPTEEQGSRLVASVDWPKLTTESAAPADFPVKGYEEFSALWTAPTKHESLATPVIAGDIMLIGTFDATVDARALSGGKLLWSMKKHEPVFTNVVALKDRAFVGEGLHTAVSAGITSFSLPDGKVLWERQFRSHVESPVLVDEKSHRLWTGAGDESMWCLDTRDGKAIWRQRIGHIDATPLLNKGTLYVISWPDIKVPKTRLYALDPDDGETKWSVDLTGDIMGSPQLGPDGVILVTTAVGQVGPKVATDKGWAHAVSPDGKVLWTVELPNLPLPEAQVLADKGLVINTIKTGEVLALNVKDGTTAWKVTLGKEIDAPSTLRADTNPPLLATMTANGVVGIINAEDGTEIRRWNMKEGGYAAPVFDKDILYITTSGSITAYGGVHLLTRGTK